MTLEMVQFSGKLSHEGRKVPMKFLDGLQEDIKKDLLQQLRALWTHTSTAIEGNTLTLGETAFVLREGLTISGKPLKDHRDVEGHARAVDLMYELVKKDKLSASDLFDLHKLVITEPVFDVYKPVGDWKKENNSAPVTINNRQTFIEYSDYWEVPQLMEHWLELVNGEIQAPQEPKDLVRAYARLHLALVSIHPFWDGNGRIARLVSNLPCLKAGQPPIIIPQEQRYEYLTALAEYTNTHGVPSLNTPIIHEDACFNNFCSFCEQCWQSTVTLVAQARAMQQNREQRQSKAKFPSP
jgi:Fic family protein